MYEMKLADIGEGMTEGEIVRVLVKVGEEIEEDQPVVEVQTDKVTAELPAPVGGQVAEILVKEGELVPVGTVILKIAQGSPGQEHGREERPTERQQVLAAPYTRKVAREHGVPIEQVPGTGKDGRITVEDVLRYVEEQASASAIGSRSATKPVQPAEQRVLEETPPHEALSSPARLDAAHPAPDGMKEQKIQVRLPYTGRRRQIGQKMVQSVTAIPHVTHFDKIDLSDLLEMKERMQQALAGNDESGGGHQRISIMAFIIKAVALALKAFPIFNAKLDEERGEIILEPEINIGLAVHTDEGLIVPVLAGADQLSIVEINQEMKALTRRAQENQLKADDLRGGTFTVSNVGPIGGMLATPIINYPEVALIAFHRLEEMPVVRNNEIVIRSMMNFSMSFDHRVADGVTAVQFTNRMKQLLEEPLQLFAHLR